MSDKMKIAHIHWGFPPIIGGVETHLSVLCPELVKHGHSVSLLTAKVAGEKDNDEFKGVKIKRTPLMDLNWLSRRGAENLQDVVENTFENFLKKNKPDLIHAHNMHYFSPLHTLTLERSARKHKIPIILHAHNIWDDGVYLELTTNIKWEHIIAISHFIKKELVGSGVPPERITVVHHGIDRERFETPHDPEKIIKKYPQLKGKRIVFHPARIGLGKGSDVAVKAMRYIKKEFSQAFLVFAGSKGIIDWVHTQERDIAYILHLIKMFGLKDSVLIDTYSIEEIAGIYQLCDVCIYPSAFGEPFGLTMLEAMAASKPMVVTDSGGMPEIIKDSLNGYVVRVRDWEALANRCMLLLTDEELRRKMGNEGNKIVREKYSKEIMTDEILSIYKRVLKRSD